MFDLVKLADMNDIVVSSKESPIIGTNNLAHCYGILFYNPLTHEAILGHASVLHYQEILNKMLSLIPLSAKEECIEYLIVPGNYNIIDNNLEIYEKIKIYLDKYDDHQKYFIAMDVKYEDVITIDQDTLSSEFVFDSSTGTFIKDKSIINGETHGRISK